MPEPAAGGTPAAGTTNNDGGAASRGGPSDEAIGVAQRALKKHRGDSRRAIAEFADENRALRDERRELKAELAKFNGADVLVLKGDDLKAYTEFKAIGKKPDDLKKELGELDGLRVKVAEGERHTAAMAAAPLLGWNADAFAAMVKDKGLVVTLVDGKDAKGVAIKVPHVKAATADDKVQAVPASDWVTANANYLMPSLTAKPAAGATGTPAKPGVQWIEQGAAGGTGAAAAGDGKPAAIPGRRTYMTPSQRAAQAQQQKTA